MPHCLGFVRATVTSATLGTVLWIGAACSRQPAKYLIGAAGPQQLLYGMQNQRGIELAVDEINRSGGIHGVPLEVVVRDDHASGADAAKIAADFVATPDVVAVVGHVGSGAMVAAAPVYDSGKLVAIGTTPSSPDLTGVSPWVFRMITSDSANGVTLANFASSFEHTLGHRPRAAILYQNDAYGRGLAEAFQRHFQGEIVSVDPIGPDGAVEPYIAYYKMRKPDLIFVASVEEIGIPLLREARRQQLDAIFLGGDGWQGVVADSASEGVYIGTPFTTQSPDTTVQRFVAAFRDKFGRLPDAYAALAYDATKLLATAISTVGADRAKVRQYLSALSDTASFHGVSGAIRFGPANDPVGGTFRIARVHQGMLIPVNAPQEARSPERVLERTHTSAAHAGAPR